MSIEKHSPCANPKETAVINPSHKSSANAISISTQPTIKNKKNSRHTALHRVFTRNHSKAAHEKPTHEKIRAAKKSADVQEKERVARAFSLKSTPLSGAATVH